MAAMRTRYLAGISRNTVLLALTSLFADISSEMLYPILPIFLTQVLHASGSVVGLVEGIAEATQNIVQGFSGWLSDKLQKRKALALIGYFVSAFGKPLMGIATAWPGVLGGRFLDRLGAFVVSFLATVPRTVTNLVSRKSAPALPALFCRSGPPPEKRRPQSGASFIRLGSLSAERAIMPPMTKPTTKPGRHRRQR